MAHPSTQSSQQQAPDQRLAAVLEARPLDDSRTAPFEAQANRKQSPWPSRQRNAYSSTVDSEPAPWGVDVLTSSGERQRKMSNSPALHGHNDTIVRRPPPDKRNASDSHAASQVQQSASSDGMADGFKTRRPPPPEDGYPSSTSSHQRKRYSPDLPVIGNETVDFSVRRVPAELQHATPQLGYDRTGPGSKVHRDSSFSQHLRYWCRPELIVTGGVVDGSITRRVPLETHQACVQYEHQRIEYSPELPVAGGLTDGFKTRRLSLEMSQDPSLSAVSSHLERVGQSCTIS
jgi:hypothetical protein